MGITLKAVLAWATRNALALSLVALALLSYLYGRHEENVACRAEKAGELQAKIDAQAEKNKSDAKVIAKLSDENQKREHENRLLREEIDRAKEKAYAKHYKSGDCGLTCRADRELVQTYQRAASNANKAAR